jgi:hypothetical protein
MQRATCYDRIERLATLKVLQSRTKEDLSLRRLGVDGYD